MRPLILIVLATGLLATAAGPLGAADKPKRGGDLVTDQAGHIAGVFDMAKQPRPYIVLLILDQEGVRYPSFWCGRNEPGKVAFKGKEDLLTKELSLGYLGPLSCLLTNAARKAGMEADMPGGAWTKNLKEAKLQVVFESFIDEAITKTEKKAAKGGLGTETTYTITAQAKGFVGVNGRKAPFLKAPMTITFTDRICVFALNGTIRFTGADLGLEGAQAGPITGTIMTASSPTTELPKLGGDSAADALGAFGREGETD